MGKLDYNPYYICDKCGNRIHQANVPNSISGNVVCCGRNMTHPGDPVISYSLIWSLIISGLTWFLTEAGPWISIGIGLLCFIVFIKVLCVIRDSGSKKNS